MGGKHCNCTPMPWHTHSDPQLGMRQYCHNRPRPTTMHTGTYRLLTYIEPDQLTKQTTQSTGNCQTHTQESTSVLHTQGNRPHNTHSPHSTKTEGESKGPTPRGCSLACRELQVLASRVPPSTKKDNTLQHDITLGQASSAGERMECRAN